MFKIYLKTVLTLLLSLNVLVNTATANNKFSQESFDSQKPEHINAEKWSDLKAIMQGQKLIPADVGSGAASDNYAQSIAIDGNRAIIGAPNASTNGVAYILNYDGSNWIRAQVIRANDGAAGDLFGYSVSIHGDRALIGAYQDVANGKDSGSAYVFDLVDGTWTQSAKLISTDAANADRFGYSVSLSADRALVGAYYENQNGTQSGSAYVFDKNGSNWSQTEKLSASDGAATDWFGYSVSLMGNRALIGAYQDDDNGSNSGSAYIYDFNGNNWTQTIKLTASEGNVNDYFGESVSLSVNRLLIGAHRNDDNGEDSGSAYIFDYNGASWSETTKLIADDGTAFDSFGTVVSLWGNKAVIGTPDENDNGSNSGAAYVFELTGGSWSQTGKLLANDGAATDDFGSAVGVSSGNILVGAFLDDDNGVNSGSAYGYKFDGNNWIQFAKLTAGDGASYDRFAYSVSMFANRALIGVYRDDVKGTSSGSAYIYELNGGSWMQTAKLLANDGSVNDEFGISVSLNGDRALIGAHSNNDTFEDSGSAYIFDYTGGFWSQTAKLTPSDPGGFEYFGKAVSLFGDRAIIGNTNDDDNGSNAGSVYVYELNGGNWSETVKLTTDIGVNNEKFGTSLSLASNRALIGAIGGSGSAYIFDYNGASWSQTAKLTANDGTSGDNFGGSVSLSGDRAVIGAKNDGNGSAYIYDFFAGGWPQTAKLTANDGASADSFGGSVSLLANRVLIGASNDNDNGANSGSAYVFDFDNGWSFTEKLSASDGASDDWFGYSVSLSTSGMLIGAHGDNDRGEETGAAYIFQDDIIFINGFE